MTSSAEPVVRGEWLKPGAHVNAVGACFPTHARARRGDGRRPPSSSTAASRAENEAGDYLLAVAGGRDRDGPHHAPSSAKCSPATRRAAPREDEITVFESLGLAVEDLAAAEYIERRARETGIGTTVEF